MTETASRFIAFALFVATGTIVLLCEYFFRLSQVAYWVDHSLFGFGFTLFMYGLLGSYRIASGFTLVWSFGNELVQDHFDRLAVDPSTPYFVQWDHLGGDLLGFSIACTLYYLVLKANRVS